MLGELDSDRANEDRLALVVTLEYVLDDGPVLGLLGFVDQVVSVVPDHLLVRRDGDDLHLVDVHELVCLGGRRARHPRELLVLPEEVLDRDRGDGLVLLPDLHPLLGLYGLVKPLGVAPSLEYPPRELVHYKDLTVAHNVLDVLVEERVRPQRLVEVVYKVGVDVVVEVLHAQGLLDFLDAALGWGDLALLLVYLVVLALPEARDNRREAVVDIRGALRHPRDDERGARLVDEDRVDLVHYGEVELALHELLGRGGDVIAQVVEAELGVGAVGEVRAVGLLALGEPHRLLDEAYLQAQKLVDLAHPTRVAPRQVVVDGDDVDALTGERVEVDGHGRGERLALACLHLGDLALVQGDPAHHLNVEGAHPQGAPGGLAHHRERLGQDVVEPFAFREPLAELVRLRAQGGVGEALHLRLESRDRLDALLEGLDLPALTHPQDSRQQIIQ